MSSSGLRDSEFLEMLLVLGLREGSSYHIDFLDFHEAMKQEEQDDN